ncbi:MAG: hypothetical protein UY97_C0017G0020, partial [Parcubacteria group bacterium GW2011_GWB1_57_6]
MRRGQKAAPRVVLRSCACPENAQYTSKVNIEDTVDAHFMRLRPDQKRALAKLGIRTIRDLLYHFPSRYERSGPSTTISG